MTRAKQSQSPEARSLEAPARTGILPAQALVRLIEQGRIASERPVVDEQIQPASLDLRLGASAYRVRASFLPGPRHNVMDKIEEIALHRMDLEQGAVLERGCVYIVPLMERLALADDIRGIANPKSSIGRLDVFTRLIAEHASEFDRIPAGYRGALYAEISPQSFSILVRSGTRLNQLRLRAGEPAEAGDPSQEPEAGPMPGDDLRFTIDLVGDGGGGLIGFRAKKHTGLIDLERIGAYDCLDFWDPIFASRSRSLILDPGDFYILASKERVTIPTDQAAEMLPYDTLVGEFRVHYAGFFDPGFGCHADGATGTTAVLEVRSHDVPFIMEDGQTVGRLVYERLTETPDRLYGQAIGSSYARQRLALSKHFKPFEGRFPFGIGEEGV